MYMKSPTLNNINSQVLISSNNYAELFISTIIDGVQETWEDKTKCFRFSHPLISSIVYTGWPKKVGRYQESSLNRIKNRQW